MKFMEIIKIVAVHTPSAICGNPVLSIHLTQQSNNVANVSYEVIQCNLIKKFVFPIICIIQKY